MLHIYDLREANSYGVPVHELVTDSNGGELTH